MIGIMEVVNVKRDGWVGVEYLGRSMPGRTGSSLANPFKTAKHTIEAHNEVVAQYRSWLWNKIKAKDPKVCSELTRLKGLALQSKPLKLGCWCKPLPCHCDVVSSCINWAIKTGYEFL